MRRLGTGVVIASSLIYGCSAPGDTEPELPTFTTAIAAPEVPPRPTYEEEVSSLERYFEQVEQYYLGQGIDVSSTNLEIVEGAETAYCGSERGIEFRADNASLTGYCHAAGAVIVTQAFIIDFTSDAFQPRSAFELPRMQVFAAHELGHPGQYKLDPTLTPTVYSQNPTPFELAADCLAGKAIAATDPLAADIVLNRNFVYLPGRDFRRPDDIHGTTEEREMSFVAGFNGADCRVA